MHRFHANQPLELPKINGLQIEITVPYPGSQLLWRFSFESLDDLRRALHAYNINLDWEGARQELRTKFSSARENLERFESLWGSISKPVPHKSVDWKQVEKGWCKAPEQFDFGIKWASRQGLMSGDWVYATTYVIGWDLSDTCGEEVRSPREYREGICQEAAIRCLDEIGYTALYRYKKDGVGELVHVNICRSEDCIE